MVCCSCVMRAGSRGSFKASASRRVNPIRRSTSRSSSPPASDVSVPPAKSATICRRFMLEKSNGSRLQSVTNWPPACRLSHPYETPSLQGFEAISISKYQRASEIFGLGHEAHERIEILVVNDAIAVDICPAEHG